MEKKVRNLMEEINEMHAKKDNDQHKKKFIL
jgi:hypothetical protein